MARRFQALDLDDFAQLLELFRFEREINGIHLHHTWRPAKSDFRGLATIEGMWRHHTRKLGWNDIAQHVTIDPDGRVWTGRDWNRPPASASGFNGTRKHGPFMIEVIGNFDRDEEELEGPQREAVLRVLAHLCRRLSLHPARIRFHNEMSAKTCPGSGIDREQIVASVERVLAEIDEQPLERDLPFGEEMLIARQNAENALRALEQGRDLPDDAPSAEPPERVDPVLAPDLVSGETTGRGPVELTPDLLEELRPHVVNLEQGRFSDDGKIATSEDEVDALFGEHLPRWREAIGDDVPLRIVLFAHGGLVSEKAGLRIVHRHAQWWKDNGIYPIYFVWETGLLETIRQLLSSAFLRSRRELPRDFADVTTDPVVELTARALGGVKIWGGMKRSAELASDTGGAARYVANKLRELYKKEAAAGRPVELHGVGHSAGSIFHAHLLPYLLRKGGPKMRTLHFLAPAVRIDTFGSRLAPLIGKTVEQLTMYTMKRSFERADKASPVYRKSLLYLVSRALETRRKTPILGLEDSLRRDTDMKRLFGLGGNAKGAARIVWSKTDATSGLDASRAVTHGGFDDDPATMNNVLRRVLDVGDEGTIAEFRPGYAASEISEPLVDLVDGWEEYADLPLPVSADKPQQPSVTATPVTTVLELPASTRPTIVTPFPGARRRALCVGINDYASAPLYGCVADAQSWGRRLEELGFSVDYLLDAQATHDRILGELRELVTSAQSGDVVVLQYAGHGTQVPDIDREEDDDWDEALVPHDYETGSYVIDDELGATYDLLVDGVNLTCFIDCCHSGTISRMARGESRRALGMDLRGSRQRVMPATTEMEQAHREYRRAHGPVRVGRRSIPTEVIFAACQDHQSAYETDGRGDFTRNAAGFFTRAVNESWSHDTFRRQLEDAFRNSTRQKPRMTCPAGWHSRALLAPYVGDTDVIRAASGPLTTDVAETLRHLAQRLDRLESGR